MFTCIFWEEWFCLFLLFWFGASATPPEPKNVSFSFESLSFLSDFGTLFQCFKDLSSSDCSLWTYPSNRLVTRIKCRWETECSCQFGSEVARISAPVVLWRVQRLTQRRIERWFLAIFEAKRSIEGREAALEDPQGDHFAGESQAGVFEGSNHVFRRGGPSLAALQPPCSPQCRSATR